MLAILDRYRYVLSRVTEYDENGIDFRPKDRLTIQQYKVRHGSIEAVLGLYVSIHYPSYSSPKTTLGLMVLSFTITVYF